MRTLALNVWHDLREKRLWPVAVVLALALVAVPVILLQQREEIAGPAPAATPAAPTAGLAEPVGVAGTSKLDRFKKRDPFGHGKNIPGLEVVTPGDKGTTDSGGNTTVSGGGAGLQSGAASGGEAPTSSGGGDTTSPASTGTGSTPSSPASSPSPTPTPPSGGGGSSPQPPETRFFTDEVDLRVRKPGGDEVTKTGLRRLFTPIPSEADSVMLYNGVVNIDSSKLAAFAVLDPATVDRDDDSCLYPAGPTTCFVFALEEGQQQRVDLGAEHYVVTVTDIRRVQVRGSE